MEEKCDIKLSRLRECCIFYLKLDFAVIAAIATLASIFQLNQEAALEYATEYRYLAQILLWLIFYALIFEGSITTTRNSEKIIQINRIPIVGNIINVFNAMYLVQIVAHTLLLIYCISFISGFLDFYANRL